MSQDGCRLDDLTVVVTRPAHQAGPLIEGLQQAGARTIAFPTIEIRPVEDAAARIRAIEDRDDLIFVSPNAVTIALRYFRPDRQRIIAVGNATARTLQENGVQVDIVPEVHADSENLLAHPGLRDVSGRRIAIIRGEGGRELLKQKLLGRGADVITADLYQRMPPDADCSCVTRSLEQQHSVITTTSNNIIDNLLQLCGRQPRLLGTPILVASQRCAAHARENGFEHVIVSPGASTGAIIDTLCEHFR